MNNLDKMDKSLDIEKMYKYQLNIINNEEYNKYLKYLNVYYSKDLKKEKYKKDYKNNKIILIDKKNSKEIKIEPAQYINIHKLYLELKEKTDIILNKITNIIETNNNITDENRVEFEELKSKYLFLEENVNNIKEIKDSYYKDLNILLNNKIKKAEEIMILYKKRMYIYSEIKEMILESVKNKLIKMYKDNNKKIPTIPIINKIAKENNVSSNEIEKWFQWIETVYFYMLVKKEIIELNIQINEKEDTFEKNTNHFIIKKPIIYE
jgi:hypothetical protein